MTVSIYCTAPSTNYTTSPTGVVHQVLFLPASTITPITCSIAGGEVELVLHYDALREDFREFMPKVRSFAVEALAADIVDIQLRGQLRLNLQVRILT
jgi:hypothetical protein